MVEKDNQKRSKLTRRDLIKTIGITTGAAVVSGGLVHTINANTGGANANPHDKIGNLEELSTNQKTDLVSAINEQAASNETAASNVDSRGVNIKYPPAPLVGAKVDGVTDDTEAIREIIKYAEAHHLNLYIPGVSVISGEIEIKKTMIVQGAGAGSGYTSAGIAGYKQKSGFLVKGNGLKRIRTRRKYRASASDPQDDPLSVAINVQAENVVFRDFSVFLDFDRSNNSKTNYGADWDIGIFVGCRTHFFAENVHVMGYWRTACWYYDVTHATNLPRFPDLDGYAYDNTFNVSGGDGCTMFKCMAWGGKWGIFVAGAIKSDSGSYYYDEILSKPVPDYRGSFGFSDFSTYSCSIYGTDHHSFYRRNKATGNYVTDDAGGAMYIDGAAANASKSVWGSRHFSTRFASFEPFRVRLDHAARVQFYGCHIEYRSGNNRKNQDGTPVKFDHTDTYGHISGTENTNHVLLIGYPGGKIDTTFMPSSVRLHNFFPSGTVTGSTTTDIIVAKGFQSSGGELDLRSSSDQDAIRFRFGNKSQAFINQTGLQFSSNYTNPSIIADAGELNLRASSDSAVRMRQGASSIGMFDAEAWRPASDNTINLGSGGGRFKQLYAGTGTINTSDRNQKQQMKRVDDKVLDAWREVNYSSFKFNDAVKEKGDEARIHIGIIAQEIEEAFKKHGLNAFDYGLLCYDEWDDMYEEEEVAVSKTDSDTGQTYTVYQKTGQKRLVRKAGRQYSIRPDECLMLESALMRRTTERLEKRIAALEDN